MDLSGWKSAGRHGLSKGAGIEVEGCWGTSRGVLGHKSRGAGAQVVYGPCSSDG